MVFALAVPAWASGAEQAPLNLTGTLYGWIGLVIFIAAYLLVILEEQLHLRKSKPVMFAAGVIWILVALAYAAVGDVQSAHVAILANLTEYAELFLFLLAAMTYINAMEERNVFLALRSWLVNKAERVHHFQGHALALAADGEEPEAARRLGAPVAVARDLEFAHGVAFDANRHCRAPMLL